jgi:hypothetical protein
MDYSSEEQELLENSNDIYLSHIYLWLRMYYGSSDITYFTRPMLNNIALRYNLIPENYKNKRVLIRAILDVFENKFNSDPDYKKKYEELHGWEKI